jgi:hypothetical protein
MKPKDNCQKLKDKKEFGCKRGNHGSKKELITEVMECMNNERHKKNERLQRKEKKCYGRVGKKEEAR